MANGKPISSFDDRRAERDKFGATSRDRTEATGPRHLETDGGLVRPAVEAAIGNTPPSKPPNRSLPPTARPFAPDRTPLNGIPRNVRL